MSSLFNPKPNAALIAQFKQAYADFSVDTLGSLRELYANEVVFIDPVHRVEGLGALERYFAASANNLRFCRFEFLDEAINEHSAFFKWAMHYSHSKIAAGSPLQLQGASFIKFAERITYHEDFYDMGAMVYEHIPVLGFGVKRIKTIIARAGNQ
jgi:hypothetical protein